MSGKIVYSLKDGFGNMDFEKVTDMLSKVPWCIGIGKKEVIQGAENSALLVGAFIKDDGQVGFARVVSDKTRFAYILDVVVNEKYRKQGIGQAMIRYIVDHHELKDVYQFILLTKDAHGVYSKVGFKPLANPGGWMEIRYERPAR
jgi:GNAT superfamily N-acetyltransferase